MKIKVKAIGLRRNQCYFFYNGKIVVNNNARGVLFSGDIPNGHTDRKYIDCKYLPFQLIKQIEITEDDGGMIVCNDPRFLSIALDVAKVAKPILEIEQ